MTETLNCKTISCAIKAMNKKRVNERKKAKQQQNMRITFFFVDFVHSTNSNNFHFSSVPRLFRFGLCFYFMFFNLLIGCNLHNKVLFKKFYQIILFRFVLCVFFSLHFSYIIIGIILFFCLYNSF